MGQDSTFASQNPVPADSLSRQKDLMDLIRSLFNKEPAPPKTSLKTSAILPAIAYNPSIGFGLGLNYVRSNYRGDPKTTKLSVAQLDGLITTKKVFIGRFRHNIFLKDNAWNLQGNWQYMRSYVLDYGLGNEARLDPTVSYPIRSNYFRLFEKIYKKIGKNLYGGIGVSFDIWRDIDDEQLDSTLNTPHYRYSIEQGFDHSHYAANGFILNFQYNTREHPNRSFGGIYADAYFRYDTKLLGSTKEAGQLYTEFRKYFSLSKQYPEHVLAFWYWGSFLLWGKTPYLDLPGTAFDTYNRSGRGYTLSRFKGPSFAYGEVEYRFPISLTTKLFSGVVFMNVQSASDGKNIGVLNQFEPGGGAGIRIQFNKRSRTYICLDYGLGLYGSSGIFFALNEAF